MINFYTIYFILTVAICLYLYSKKADKYSYSFIVASSIIMIGNMIAN